MRQTDGPILDQDEDEAENEYESYDAEADSNDTYLPTKTAFSTTVKVSPVHLFESEDPEPDEYELNEFDTPMQHNTPFCTNTPTGATPFRNTVIDYLQNSPLAPSFLSPISFHGQTVNM